MPDHLDYRRSRAVLIGTAEYQDPGFRSTMAIANSLRAMRQVMVAPDLCGWPNDRVEFWENWENVTTLSKALRAVARQTDDVLLLYYVGHGVLLPNGELCLAIADTDYDNPDFTGLAYSRVRQILLDSPARVKIVVLDCCYSGRAVEALSGSEIADYADTRGVYTLTASDDVAHTPGERETSATTSFTGELVRLVRTGIPNQAEQLTLGVLYKHLRYRLRQRGLPDPNHRGTDNADHFGFTRNAAFESENGYPARFQGAIEESAWARAPVPDQPWARLDPPLSQPRRDVPPPPDFSSTRLPADTDEATGIGNWVYGMAALLLGALVVLFIVVFQYL